MSNDTAKKIYDIVAERRDMAARHMESELSRIKALPREEQLRYRRKIIYVTPDAVADLLKPPQPKRITIFEGMPEDAEIITVGYDVARACFQVIVTSDEFDITPAGFLVPPELTITGTSTDVKTRKMQ